eukprot:s154_g100.t1
MRTIRMAGEDKVPGFGGLSQQQLWCLPMFGRRYSKHCSLEKDEHIYHERLVHVPLLLCPKPRRVVICGGGNGGAAREVLKHKSVKEVFLIEIDPAVRNAAKRFIQAQSAALSDSRVTTIFVA